MNKQNNLPSTINGDGRKFISLLKGYLNDIKASLEDQINEATKIWNGIADNPDTIPEQVRNITIDERSVNGSVSLILKWDSTPIKQYAGVSIDVKVGDFHDTVDQFADKQVHQHYDTGKTNIFTIPNVEIGKKYEFVIRGRDIRNALSEKARAPVTYYYVSEQTHVPEAPYEATVIFDKRGAYWSWKQKPQNDYQWTELRLDEYVGEEHNRLDLTTDWHSTAKPYARVGTGYIYNKGVGNSYSVPAKVNYSKAVPSKPTQFVVKPVIEGLNITFASIPEDCTGAIVYVNNEENFVADNSLNYLCSTGTYTVKVCYTDIFGNGEMSDSVTISTIEEIPIEMLNKEKLGIDAINHGIDEINKARKEVDKQINGLQTSLTAMNGIIDAKVQNAQKTAESRLTSTANAINSMVQDNVNQLKTSITQVADSIEVKVSAGIDKITGKEIISRINLTKDTVSISGKYLHITNETVFDNGVIVSRHIGDETIVGTKIADGAITTDKLAANAITANKIASKSITSDKILVGSINSTHIATNAITADKIQSGSITGDKVVAGTITGDKIAANTISGDKIQAGSIDANKIKAGSITGEKIASKSISGDKLQVNTLSSLSARIGVLKTADSGARTVITDNLIEVYDEQNRLRVRIGVWN